MKANCVLDLVFRNLLHLGFISSLNPLPQDGNHSPGLITSHQHSTELQSPSQTSVNLTIFFLWRFSSWIEPYSSCSNMISLLSRPATQLLSWDSLSSSFREFLHLNLNMILVNEYLKLFPLIWVLSHLIIKYPHCFVCLFVLSTMHTCFSAVQLCL